MNKISIMCNEPINYKTYLLTKISLSHYQTGTKTTTSKKKKNIIFLVGIPFKLHHLMRRPMKSSFNRPS
jgi:hypothetical protein